MEGLIAENETMMIRKGERRDVNGRFSCTGEAADVQIKIFCVLEAGSEGLIVQNKTVVGREKK